MTRIYRIGAVLLFCFLSTFAFSTVPLQASLEQLASEADHILAGHVIGVDMIDAEGRAITNLSAMTGPGLKNTIRLIIKVDQVFFSNAKAVPETIRVPLDPLMHFSLGQISDAHREPSNTFLLILRGPFFEPVVPGIFARDLNDKETALAIRAKTQASPRKVERRN